jgi:hypothetical protein
VAAFADVAVVATDVMAGLGAAVDADGASAVEAAVEATATVVGAGAAVVGRVALFPPPQPTTEPTNAIDNTSDRPSID